MADETFSKRDRLRKRSEFLELQRGAPRKVHAGQLLLLWAPRPRTRVGITVSSRVGNAVVRNRLKRWIREYVRRHKTDLPVGDLVVVAKPSASDCTHDMLDRDLGRLLARAGQRS